MKRIRHIIEYIFLFVCNGILFWFFRGYFNLLIGAGMLVLFLYAFFSVHILRSRLSLSIQVPEGAISKNTEFFLRMQLNNRCILPLVKSQVFLRIGNVFVAEPGEKVFILPVCPRGAVEACYSLESSYVGMVRVQAEKIVLWDLLGFHAVSLPADAAGEVVIMPSGKEEGTYSLNAYEKGMEDAEESQLAGSDFSEVSQIREYVPGDAMKNIHWKLSAKRNDLMVKERLSMSSRKLLVVLSLDRDNADAVDETMEILFGFGKYFIRNRIPVSLFWWSEKYRELRQETADSEAKWNALIIQLFRSVAGSGLAEEHFRTLYPGKGYIEVSSDGIRVRE